MAAGLLLATAPLASAEVAATPFDCVVDTAELDAVCFDPLSHEFCLVRYHNLWIDVDICPGG